MLSLLAGVSWLTSGKPRNDINATSEEKSLSAGEARVKFSALCTGNTDQYPAHEISQLATLLFEMEQQGAAPVLPDGKVGGNAALLLSLHPPRVLVSRSGKEQGRMTEKDFVEVSDFDRETWSAKYQVYGDCDPETVRPTSDTPLHWASLVSAARDFGWQAQPVVALHGHALEDSETAASLGFPVSEKETLFSTREDLEMLENLFLKYHFPDYRIYVRKGHGFFILARGIEGARTALLEDVVPNIR